MEVLAKSSPQAGRQAVHSDKLVEILQVVAEDHGVGIEGRNDPSDGADYDAPDHRASQHDGGRDRVLRGIGRVRGDVAVADGRDCHDAPVEGRERGPISAASKGVVSLPSANLAVGAGVRGRQLKTVAIVPEPRVDLDVLRLRLRTPDARKPMRAKHHAGHALKQREVRVIDLHRHLPAHEDA
eukprot:7019670-Prymnesium_polylepis.1